MLGDKWKTSFVLLIMFFEPTTQKTGRNYGALHKDSFQNLGESPTVVLPEGCIEMCDDQGCLFFCPEPSKQIKRCVTRSTLNKRLCCATDGPIAPAADTHQMLSMDPIDPETMAKYGGTPLNLAAQKNVARLQKAAEAKLQLRKTLDNLKALREQRKIALANVKSKENKPLPYNTKIMTSDLKDRKPTISKIPSLDLTKIRRPLPIVNPSFNHKNNGGKISHYAIMDTTPDVTDEVRDESPITVGNMDKSIPDEHFNDALANITEENSMLNRNTDLSLENSLSNLTHEGVPIVSLSNESDVNSGTKTITNSLPSYSIEKQNGNTVPNEDYTPIKVHETQLTNDGMPGFESFSAVPLPSSKETEQTSFLAEQPSIEMKPNINAATDARNDERLLSEITGSLLADPVPSSEDTGQTSYLTEQPSTEIKSYAHAATDTRNDERLLSERTGSLLAVPDPSSKETGQTSYLTEQPSTEIKSYTHAATDTRNDERLLSERTGSLLAVPDPSSKEIEQTSYLTEQPSTEIKSYTHAATDTRNDERLLSERTGSFLAVPDPSSKETGQTSYLTEQTSTEIKSYTHAATDTRNDERLQSERTGSLLAVPDPSSKETEQTSYLTEQPSTEIKSYTHAATDTRNDERLLSERARSLPSVHSSAIETEGTPYMDEQPIIENKSYINEMAETINDGLLQNERTKSLPSVHLKAKETGKTPYMEEQPIINTGNLFSDTDVNYKPGHLDTPSKDLVESLIGIKGTSSVPEADLESNILKNEHIFPTVLTSSQEIGNLHSDNVYADNKPLLAPERTSLTPVEGASSSETNVSNEVSNLQSTIFDNSTKRSIYHNNAKSEVEPDSSDSYLNEFALKENITDVNNNFSSQEYPIKAKEEDVSEQPLFHSKMNLLNNVLNEAISTESTNLPVNEDISTFLSDGQKVKEHIKTYDQPDTNKLSENENKSIDTIHLTNIKDDEIKVTSFKSDAKHASDDSITTYRNIVNREGYLPPQALEVNFGDSNIAEKHNLTGVSPETNNQAVHNSAEMLDSGKPQDESKNIQPPQLRKTKNKIICITDDKLDNHKNDLISGSVLNVQRVISKGMTEQSETNNNGLRLPPGSVNSNEDDELKSEPVIAYHYNPPRKMDLLPDSLTLEGKNSESNEMMTLNEKSTNSPEEYGKIVQLTDKTLSRSDSERKNGKHASDNKETVSLPIYELMPEGELSSERTEAPKISILMNEKEMSNADIYNNKNFRNTHHAINNENKGGSGDLLESNSNSTLDLINNNMTLNLQNYNIEQRSAQDKDYFKIDENPAINPVLNSYNSQEENIDEQNIPDYRPVIENDFIGDDLTNEKEMSNADIYNNTNFRNTHHAINNENNGDILKTNSNNTLDLINNNMTLNLQNYNIEQRSAQDKDYFKIYENPAINSHLNSYNRQEENIDEQNIPDYRPLIENDFNGDDLFHRDVETTWYDDAGEGFKKHLNNNTFNDSKLFNLGDENIGDVHYGQYVLHQPEIDYGKHIIKIKPDPLPTKNGTDTPIKPHKIIKPMEFLTSDNSSRSDIRRSLDISELSEKKINQLNFVETDADEVTENRRESNASQEGEHFSESQKTNKDFNNYVNSPESLGIAKSIDWRQFVNSPLENDSHRLRTSEPDLETLIESSTTVKYNVHQYDKSLFTAGELKDKQITEGSDEKETAEPLTQSKHESLTKAPEENSQISNSSLMQILNSDVFQASSSGFDEDHISDRSLEEIENLIKDGKMKSLLELYSIPSEVQNLENVLHNQKPAYPSLNTNDNSKNNQEPSEPRAIKNEEKTEFEVDAPQMDSSKQFINREREILIHEIKKFIEDPSISNISRKPLFKDNTHAKTNLSGNLGRQISYTGTEGSAISEFSTEGGKIVNYDIPNENGESIPQIEIAKSKLLESFTDSNHVTVNKTDNTQQDDVSDYNTDFIGQFKQNYNEQNANLNIYNSLNNTGKEKAIKSALHFLEDLKIKLNSNSTDTFNYGREDPLKLKTNEMGQDNSPIQEETSIPSKEPISTISHHHTVLLDNLNINDQIKYFNNDLNPLPNSEYPYNETSENSELDSILGNDSTRVTEQYNIMGDIQSSRNNSMAPNEVTSINTSSVNGTTDFQRTVSSEVFQPTTDMKEENYNLSEIKPIESGESGELILENDSQRSDQPLSEIDVNNETMEEPARVEKQLEISSKAQNGGSFEDLQIPRIDSNNYLGVKEDIFNNTFQSFSEPSTATDINSQPPVSNTESMKETNSLESAINGDNLSKNYSSNFVLKNILTNNLSSESAYDEPSKEAILEKSIAEEIIDKALINERKSRLSPNVILHRENNRPTILDAVQNTSSEEMRPYILDSNSNTENITNNKDILANIKKGQLNGIFDLYKLLDLNYSSRHPTQENEDESAINLESKMSGGKSKCSCNKGVEASNEIDSSREKRSKSGIYPPIYIFSGGNYVINVAGKPAISILPKANDTLGISGPEHHKPFEVYEYIMGRNAQKLDSNEAEELIHKTDISFTGEDRKTTVKANYADRQGHEYQDETLNFSHTHNDDDSSDSFKSINPNSNNNYHSSGSDLNPTPTARTRDILRESFHSLSNGQDENSNHNLIHEENKTEDQQNKEYDIALNMDKDEKPQYDSNNYFNNAHVSNNVYSENGQKIISNIFPNPYTTKRINTEASYLRDSENPPVTEGPQVSTNWSYDAHEGNLEYPASTYIYVRT